jgi:uncharacterized membrane protein
MSEALNVIMRWLHLSSAVTLVGGLLYARLAMTPASEIFAPEAREALSERATAAFRPLVFAAIAGLLISGLYNIVTSPGHTVRYAILLGIKLLLAAHVFVVAALIVQPKNPWRVRLMTGAFLSGLAIIMIAAYLRHIF